MAHSNGGDSSTGGATDGCRNNVYGIMGHEGSHYLLLKNDNTIFYDVEEEVEVLHCTKAAVDVHNVEAYLSGNSTQEALCRSQQHPYPRTILTQPKQLKVNKLERYGKSETLHYRVLVDDISYGKEKISIPVVNDLDNSKPPAFNYITKMVHPQLKKFANARGCHCIDGCSDLVRCSCVIKNDGMVPFNEVGALVRAKETFVYECGPSCKCPPSCMNRVSQHGLKIQLEVFKTETRGWGVRSRNFISSGSFICEYVGELLDDKEAEKRIDLDEYLFDIGDEGGFAIDGAKIGNIGRFVNHSCSPNLYAQNVLFDHDDKMMPHVMLFATRTIHPLQELTYNYNYTIGHVRDANGNVKKKKCHCGARMCKRRLY